MSGEEADLRVTVEHTGGMAFQVAFDWPEADTFAMDEPEPLGEQAGPNASRLLAASVANCLSASLLFCLRKARAEPAGLRAEATGRLTRNERGRLRVGELKVEIRVTPAEGQEVPELGRCPDLFEDFCVITESVRQGIPIEVTLADAEGNPLRTG